MSWFQNIQSQCTEIGLNIFGVADGAPYQEVIPNCQSVIVIANGGSKMWEHFLEDCKRAPDSFTQEENPLDTWIEKHLHRIDPASPSSRKLIRCAATDQFIDFRPLAIEAGLGHHSHLGLVIHPKYGLWNSLRAAIFTTEYFKPTILTAQNPCHSCSKICASQCFGSAFTEKGWSVQTCASFHQNSDLCATSCNARLSCPIGREYQHLPLAHHYHSNKSSGRKAICEHLKIIDQAKGESPKWEHWNK